MTVAADRTGRCPNCGAEVQFKLGSSLVTVCEYCKSLVSRAGANLELIGKVADLAPAQSGIALGTSGRINNAGFTVAGRLQYEWKSGTWDEWYLSFSDGRWGWLAEAQGRYYLTFKVEGAQLPAQVPAVGARLMLAGKALTVTDLKKASIIGAAGELPEKIAPNEPHASADLEGENQQFGTLDYRSVGTDVTLYLGTEVPFEALNLRGLSTGPQPGSNVSHATADKLACPKCGAPIELLAPDLTVRVSCPSCNSLIDLSQGKLRVLAKLTGGHKPPIAVGSRAVLRGKNVLLIGFMERSCVVDGQRYPWREYLLFEAANKAFSWLVESDGHWQLATPISAASVTTHKRSVTANGKDFRHFSSVTGTVDRVLGEFYWEVMQGDSSKLDDYIAPPEGLSSEKTDDELNWSHLTHLDTKEILAAFPNSHLPPEVGVGEIQPWPHVKTLQKMKPWMWSGFSILTILFLYFSLQPSRVLLDKEFTHDELLAGATVSDGELADAGTPASSAPQPKIFSYLSPQFDLQKGEALKLTLSSDVHQSWTFAAGALIAQASGDSVEFGLESSYYSDSDGDEGSQTVHESLRAPGDGATLLRADLQWDPAAAQPPTSHLTLKTSTVSGYQFLAALGFLLWPLLLSMGRSSFETERWSNSNLGDH